MAESTSTSEAVDTDADVQADNTAHEDTGADQANETDSEGAVTDSQNSDASEEGAKSEQTETETEEQFFDPSEIPDDLPEEQKAKLLATWKSMQGSYTRKTQALKQKPADQAPDLRAPAVQSESGTDSSDIRGEVLRRLKLDDGTMTPQAKQVVDLMVQIATEAADIKTSRAVAPIYANTTKQEVGAFFEKNPDAKSYRTQMAEIDRRTGERLTLEELHTLASSKDREIRTSDELSKRAGARRLQNAESSQGSSAAGAAPNANPIDKLVTNYQERNLRLP
jgi:hypothetical protein